MEYVKMIISPLLSCLITALITWTMAKHSSRKEANELLASRLQKLEDSNRAILHETILKKCNQLLIIGSVTPEELDELEYLYKPYVALNGNHRAEKAYNLVLELPRVKNHEKE